MAELPYPALDPDQYLLDPSDVYIPPFNTGGNNPTSYVIHSSNAGQAMTGTMTFYAHYLFTTELYFIPSNLQIVVQHGGMRTITKSDGSTANSVIFQNPADGREGAAGATGAVMYYPAGTPFTSMGEGGTPTAAGEFGWTNDVGQGVFTFDSADEGKEVVIRYMYLNPDYQQFESQFSGQLDFDAGTQGQAASAYMQGSHPNQSVGYSLTALVEGDNVYIGMSGAIPDYTYEVQGFGIVGAGTMDAEPISCIATLLTDEFVGIGFPAASIDNGSWYDNGNAAQKWTNATELYVSQAITNPEAVSGIIGRWLTAFNIAAVWSEGLLKLIPYGDESLGEYAPDNTVQAELDDDDLLDDGKNYPVKLTRAPWADAFNRVQVNYRNRDNSYNRDLVYEQDEGSVERFGLRMKGPESCDFIATWQIASAVANMRLKRLVTVRNSYEFALPITYEYLEPMDLVSLTDTRLGLDGLVVRITKIANAPGGTLQVTCEDWPGNGYAMPVSNPKAAVPPLHPTGGTAGAGRTAAIILQASNIQSNQTGTRIYIWCGPEDVASWGGCTVYVSLDGSNYTPIGDVMNAGAIYTLTAALPSVTANPSGALGLTHDTTSEIALAGAGGGAYIQTTAGLSNWDPDTNYAQGAACIYDGAPRVAVVSNEGSTPTDANPNWQKIAPASTAAPPLGSVTETAASALANLCAVIALSGGAPSALELLTYATVGAGPVLSDLYRGALGTTISAFAAGAQLVPFDNPSLTWDVPPGLAAQKVYFRFAAWNQKGASTQSVDLAEDVGFTIAAAGAIGVWEGLAGPISGVVNSSGELIVNPPAGVIGNLPLANHAVSVQTGSANANLGLNASGQVIVGTAATPVSTLDTGVAKANLGLGTSGEIVVGTSLTPVADIDSGSSRANATIDSGNVVVAAGIDLSRSYTNKNQDYIPPGGSWSATPLSVGAEGLIENGSFQSGTAGWVTNGSASFDVESNNPPVAGMKYLHCHAPSAQYGLANQIRRFTVQPGEAYKIGGWMNSSESLYIDLQFEDANGNEIADLTASNTVASTWQYVTNVGTVPSGATQAVMFLAASNVAGEFYFTGVNAWRVRSLDDEVKDGTTTGRTARIMQYFGGNSSNGWFLLGTWTFPADNGGHALLATAVGGQGYNGGTLQQSKVEIIIRSGDGSIDNVAPNISGASYMSFGQNNGFVTGVKVVSHGGSTSPTQTQWDLYVNLSVWCAAHWVFDMGTGSTFTWAATPGTPATDPGAASSTVVIATGGAVLNPILGAGLAAVLDDPAGKFNRLLGVGSDNTGLRLGYPGNTQLQIQAGGVIGPSTGGYQVQFAIGTQPTATTNGTTYTGGQQFYFASGSGSPYLLSQDGSALPAFDSPPVVILTPYGMSTPPLTIYATNITTTGFIAEAYDAGTQGGGSGSLSNGVTHTYAPGATVTSVTVSASVFASQVLYEGHPEEHGVISVGYNVGGTTGSIEIPWSSTGTTYSGSATVSVNTTSVGIEASWSTPLPAGVSSVSASWSASYQSGATAATDLNFTAQIFKDWS